MGTPERLVALSGSSAAVADAIYQITQLQVSSHDMVSL